MKFEGQLLGCLLLATRATAAAAETDCTAAKPDYWHTPVVFVHGLGQGSGVFEIMRCQFERAGYPPEYLRAIDYTPSDESNSVAAEQQLAPFIEESLAMANEVRERLESDATPFRKVDLIAHSMGALSTRWYAAFAKPERVRTLVTTVGANHGTDWGCPGRAGSGHAEMCPAFARSARQSALQVKLNGAPRSGVDETPYGLGIDPKGTQTVGADETRAIRFITIRLPWDEYIQPADSTELRGAGPLPPGVELGAELRELSAGNYLYRSRGAAHDEVPRAPEIATFIEALLRASERSPD
jgi:pimeloyl-ACP methyl ester carboxylesterase